MSQHLDFVACREFRGHVGELASHFKASKSISSGGARDAVLDFGLRFLPQVAEVPWRFFSNLLLHKAKKTNCIVICTEDGSFLVAFRSSFFVYANLMMSFTHCVHPCSHLRFVRVAY